MADVNVTVERMNKNGIVPTYTGALSISDNYFVRNGGKLFLHFKKSGAGDCDVTVVTAKTVNDLAIADVVVTVPATTGDKMIGPLSPGIFNDGNGNVEFTVDEITGLTVAAVEL